MTSANIEASQESKSSPAGAPTRRVLVASDVAHWTTNFVAGYRAIGWECDVGLSGLSDIGDVDLVHLNWPEEHVRWQSPSMSEVAGAVARVRRWKQRARVILTVNNLYPHGAENDPGYRALYEAFFDLADVIHHQSYVSHTAVLERYPATKEQRHVVTQGFNYDVMLPPEPLNRDLVRQQLGFNSTNIVFLLFGAVRASDEIELFRRAYSRFHSHEKRLIAAINFAPRENTGWRWRSRVRRWQNWLKREGATSTEGFVPDEKVCELFAAADVVVVPRVESLTSGVPCLALTLSRTVVAPRLGAMAEHLANTSNPLYEPADADALANAMRCAAKLDRASVELANRLLADSWGWGGILGRCVDAITFDGRAEEVVHP